MADEIAPQGATDDSDSQVATETDWKAEARKWESRAKENLASAKANETAAQRLAQIEESQKTEVEKAQARLEELTSRATRAERENARLAVIAEHQIPKDYQDLIRGDDEESLIAAAQKVAALINATAPSDRATLVIPDEGGHPNMALNDRDGLSGAIFKALGISG